MDACLRAVAIYRPAWWALENPPGRLTDYLGPAAWSFQPWQFGDPWTKQTYLWGCFSSPTPLVSSQARRTVTPVLVGESRCRDRTSRLSSKDPRRSETPPGFARAFFEANP